MRLQRPPNSNPAKAKFGLARVSSAWRASLARSLGLFGCEWQAIPWPGATQRLKGIISMNPNGIPQRSPGLARSAYPGNEDGRSLQPRRGCAFRAVGQGATLSGLAASRAPTQGRRLAPTLGFGTQSLWDWQ